MHPLSEKCVAQIDANKRAVEEDRVALWKLREIGSSLLLREAADALDAYHEALDGLEIVRCGMCDGGGQGVICDQPSMPAHGYIGDCPSCNGTGKRLRKPEPAPEAGEE